MNGLLRLILQFDVTAMVFSSENKTPQDCLDGLNFAIDHFIENHPEISETEELRLRDEFYVKYSKVFSWED